MASRGTVHDRAKLFGKCFEMVSFRAEKKWVQPETKKVRLHGNCRAESSH